MTISLKSYFLLPVALFFTLLLPAQQSQFSSSLDSSNYFVKQLNGLNALLSPQPQASNVVITYYVKTGTVYENDSASGISYVLQNILGDKIKAHLSNGYNKVNNNNTTFNVYTTTEMTIYQLTSAPANYKPCLQLLRDSLNLVSISEKELQNALQKVTNEIELSGKDYLVQFNNKLMHRLYRKDADLLLVKGDTTKFSRIDLGRIRSFFVKYYIPNNVIISAAGNFDSQIIQKDISDIFKEVIKGDFDPQMITKIVDFKPMVYNTRFVMTAPVQIPEIRINWLFPGARSNVQSSYCGILLSTMLNDPNNYIHMKLTKMGCQRFSAEYEANNFNGVLKIVVQPDKKNFYETYNFVLEQLHQLDKTLLNTTMMNAGKVAFKKQFEAIKQSKAYSNAVIKYWVYNDESYFPTLGDSVASRKLEDMRKFIIEYINQSPHVTGLLINEADRQEVKIDSFFVEIDESVNKTFFTYKRNVFELEGPENLHKMNVLLQWLKENPDLIVQVNGLSDVKELNRFRDDSIKVFIDSMPTFEQVKKEFVKTGTFRLATLRAMKLAKYIYDQGIAADRLMGTGMSFTSKNKEEEAQNMRATLTVEKLKKAPSLYEYHYGKPRPTDPPNYQKK